LASARGAHVLVVDPRGRHRPGRGVAVVRTACELDDHMRGTRVVLIDDADLIPAGELAGLAALIRLDGPRLVVARSVTGAARAASEPLLLALRDAQASTLLLPGDSAEGPLAAGVRAEPGPPGRGVLFVPGEPPLPLQLYAPDDDGVVIRLRGAA